MHIFKNLAILLSTHVIAAAAKGVIYYEYYIDVGKDGLSFTPNTTTTKSGDTIYFIFHPGNHSVISGDYMRPCMPNQPGSHNHIYSGLIPPPASNISVCISLRPLVFPNYNNTNKETWTTAFKVDLNNSDPIWFFDPQSTGNDLRPHCSEGMVGVINPPKNKTQTFEVYRDAALASNVTTLSRNWPFNSNISVGGDNIAWKFSAAASHFARWEFGILAVGAASAFAVL